MLQGQTSRPDNQGAPGAHPKLPCAPAPAAVQVLSNGKSMNAKKPSRADLTSRKPSHERSSGGFAVYWVVTSHLDGIRRTGHYPGSFFFYQLFLLVSEYIKTSLKHRTYSILILRIYMPHKQSRGLGSDRGAKVSSANSTWPPTTFIFL